MGHAKLQTIGFKRSTSTCPMGTRSIVACCRRDSTTIDKNDINYSFRENQESEIKILEEEYCGFKNCWKKSVNGWG